MRPSGAARLAGVVGWPVAHSLSPRLHGAWLDRYGIDGAYVPFAVDSQHLECFLRLIPHMGVVGVNITLPHKEAALALMDAATPIARQIGAVNMVTVEDGRLVGDNTDAPGFWAHLRASLGARGIAALHGRPLVVLGAGGAARAVAAALLDHLDGPVRVINRSLARAQSLAAMFATERLVPIPWESRAAALEEAGLIVNATSLGMAGAPPLALALDRAMAGAVVYDCVYSPLETALLKQAKARGLGAIGGLGMLAHQARPAFARWFGAQPEVTAELYDELESALRAR
ncbi:MAG: shikimate dehydrogenase [Pseudomonadota bacterium]